MLPKRNWATSSVIKEFINTKPEYSQKIDFILCKYYPLEDKKLFSVVVPKRIVSKAVERNKYKRKIKFALAKKTDELINGLYVIIFLRKPSIKEYEEISFIINKVLPKNS